MNGHKLGFINVALMYVGTIMGAGFASGREIWQFFGVFGGAGYIGIIVVGSLFIIVGIMTSIIARKLRTNDMGRVIVPAGHKGMVAFVGYFMAFMLFTVLITMSSAGGALFHQQFGQSRILGGAVIIALVIITVIGGFDRVSRVFHYLMPVLVFVVIGVCLLVVIRDLPASGLKEELAPSPLAPTWFLSAVLYVSYNMLAVVPIVATASMNAKNSRHAVWGAALGGIFLAALAFALVKAMMTDMNFSQSMDMPMLAYSQRLSPIVNVIYTCVLFFAIYASATSNYYGFTTKLQPSPRKKWMVIVIAWIGFLFGLMGFKNVVAYMFPLEGFLGIAIIIMVIVNFVRVMRMDKTKQTSEFYDIFGVGYDRFDFPEGVQRVTAGHGGEAILIYGTEKTALLDCGMSYCGDEMVENLRKALNGRTLDYVLLSHSHYDHIGALPYVRKAYPKAVTYGAEHAQKILQRPGARKLMKELGEVARDKYAPGSTQEIITEGLVVDVLVGEGDRISLGDSEIVVLETKGHTDCSLTFVLEPESIMFASESTGILEGINYVHTPILKGYSNAIESFEKCKAYGAKYIVLPHFGVIPPNFNKTYWELYEKELADKRRYLANLVKRGLTEPEILQNYAKKYWDPIKEQEQPYEAFMINSKHIVHVLLESL